MANYYIAPAPEDSSESALVGWSRELIQTGVAYLKSQPNYKYIQEGIDLVDGMERNEPRSSLSNVRTENTLRNSKELIASQTNIRVIPIFNTEHREFYETKLTLNKMYMGWQSMTFADRSIRKAAQYGTVAGTGYTGIRWEPNYWYKGKGDIVLDTYGPEDVLPVGLDKSHNLQRAYAVALKVATPYHDIIRRYPAMRDKISPSRDGTKNGNFVRSAAVEYATAALRRFGIGSKSNLPEEKFPWASLDVYYIYIDDDSINTSGEDVLMGRPGTSWAYTVPSLGSDIPKGNNTFSRADADDARLYPNKRKLIYIDGHILNPEWHDQVSEYHHGQIPVVQWRMDDWPWMFLGTPMTRYGSTLEKANNNLLRGYVDALNARLSPPRGYNNQTMTSTLAEAIDPRVPNQVVGLDMIQGKDQLFPLMPAEYYNVPANLSALIQENEARIKNQMGVADAAALTRARQLPSGDSFEKIMEQLGPLIKDMSRNMEASIRDLGNMWKSMAFQWYDSARRFEVIGEQGVIEVDIDYDPGKLVPSSIPGMPENSNRYQLAKKHADNFTFSVAPYSLHELNSVTRKLFHLQLQRAGFPLSWWTLAEIFDVKNFGPKPQIPDPETGTLREANSELELWTAQKEIEIRMAAAAQQAAGGGQGGHGGQGRKPTGQNPPSLEQKPGGGSTIRESKK